MIARAFSQKRISDRLFDIGNYSLLIAVTVITLYPMLYVLFASISNPSEFGKKAFTLLLRPVGKPQLAAYRYVLTNQMIMKGFVNTLFYVVAGTLISMILTLLGAYVLSRKGYMLKKPLTLAIMFTMYFSGGLIPTYMQIRNLHMLDSVWAVLLPSAVNTFNMIVMRTAFDSVPESLHESAMLDGAHDPQIFLHIFLPLAIPTIAVIGLFYAVSRWNAWFEATIYLTSRSLYPAQLILREMLILMNSEYLALHGGSTNLSALGELIKYAAIIVATLPIVILYPFIQKYFVKGVMIGAVKE
ncbi:putative ABC transporter permease protein YtcP [Clostridia bacterium]|nr:putative ABC transporter permease protein YtcP [Clostridia bacterium]